ncbi:L-2-hydroxyglutarate oxidase [Halomonas campisalis]|uniref:L-2-hydroxyglutarate oxidase n=1 Tax=Billgrantia campisalis TaxID=74661 RepID=A0ABS9P4A2_9GAMM|nr:L-2-hydroxyglutarate oxidase [Halomonas campisalis]MCG6656626.1 L-2-hydroxyglutarate oxidase [Halomonas campisalis]MDR5861814.1 L-2-hydroxyglutarate oxidase [Halomonas campisalis]
MYDFIIIGGGILGFSTAMQLAERFPDKKMLLVEKESGPARHQSGHNSGVIHAGVYYAPGSLKARFCLAGNRATREFCDRHKIDYEICGKLLVATNPRELTRMEALWERTAANGLEREWLCAEALAEREPHITGMGALFIPSSGIVDYARVAEAMGDEFQRRGGQIRYDHKVTGLDERAGEVLVTTSQGEYSGRYLVSCSGLMADRVVRLLGRDPGFTICPFRGEYYRLADRHSGIVNHLIYPIPDPSMPFLGVHLTRMIDGSVTVGPNAVLALKREGYRKRDVSLPDMARMFTNPGILKVLGRNFRPGLVELKNSLFRKSYLAEVRKYCPSLALDDLEPWPAGVRAQAVSRDGRLIDDFLFVNTRRTVNVCNAPSPAATSAIPIGRHIVKKVCSIVQAS